MGSAPDGAPAGRRARFELMAERPGAAKNRLDANRHGSMRFHLLLRRARGFRVLGPCGRIGTVVGHQLRPDGSVEALVVRTGVLRHRRIDLPTDAIEWVLPRGRRLLINGKARPDAEGAR